MDRDKQGQRRTYQSAQGPQLPNYMKQPMAVDSAASHSAYMASRGAGGNVSRTSNSAVRTAPQANRTGASGSGGHGGKRKRRPTRSQKFLRLALIVFGALLLVVAGILLLSGETEDPTMLDYMQNGTKFLDGITVEGIDVSGLSLEEAKPLIEQAVSRKLNSVSITLQYDGNSWAFTAADMNLSANTDDVLTQAMAYGREGTLSENTEARELLKTQGKAFSVTLSANRTALTNRLNTIAPEASKAPIEPHAVPSLNENNVQSFEFVEGQDGLTLNAESTANNFEAALREGRYQDTLEPVFDASSPTLTMDFIKENTKRISTFTTRFKQSSSDEIVQNRVFNIKKAAERINGYVVQPNEEWSFNGWVGMRTKADGWKEANGISGGKEYTLQAGGGICQVSTTLYNALLCGNIPVTDRKNHSIPSDYVPKGLDATVDSSGIDLKFLNDTGAPMYLFLYITNDPESDRYLNITVSIYGKPLTEGVTYKTRSEIVETTPRTETKYTDDPTIPKGYQLQRVAAHDGFVAKAYRDKYINGKLDHSEYLYQDKYRGNVAEISVGTGDPLTTAIPEGAVPVTGIAPVEGTDDETDPGTQTDDIPNLDQPAA